MAESVHGPVSLRRWPKREAEARLTLSIENQAVSNASATFSIERLFVDVAIDFY